MQVMGGESRDMGILVRLTVLTYLLAFAMVLVVIGAYVLLIRRGSDKPLM